MDNSSDNLRIWGVDAQTLAVWIIKFFSIIAIVLLLLTLARNFDSENSPSFWATFIGSCIAIANALLLYATLRSQNESIVNTKEAHRQERFETTFFNLLDNKQKIIDEISFTCEAMDENACILYRRVNGREFFSFALNELQLITESLKSNDNNEYEGDDIEGTFQSVEEKYAREDPTGVMNEQRQREERKVNEWARIRFYNSIYNIRKEDRQLYFSNPQIPYMLFRNKKYLYFEHYVRYLYYFLQFVNDEKTMDENIKQRYITFAQAQMSRDELQLIEIHAHSFPAFRKMLDKTHLTDIITQNKI